MMGYIWGRGLGGGEGFILISYSASLTITARRKTLQLSATRALSGAPRVTARTKSVKPTFLRWMQGTGFTLRTWEHTRNQLLATSMGSGDLKFTTTSQRPIGTHSLIPRPSPPFSFNITVLARYYAPFVYKPPFRFARIRCEGIFISNLSPPWPRKNSATPTNERKVRTHRTTLYRV